VKYGGSGRLCREDYETLGGVRGSIEAAVEAAFTDPGRDPAIPRTRVPLRMGFIPWLARIDPDTEERKRRVARWEEIPVDAHPLLDSAAAPGAGPASARGRPGRVSGFCLTLSGALRYRMTRAPHHALHPCSHLSFRHPSPLKSIDR
jgi:hypothetical protein